MEQIWSKRFSSFIQERIFLLKRLANGFAFLPIILIMLGLYYYPILLDTIPEQFPVPIILAIVIAWSVSRGKYRSFLLESDIVYLTPIESKMKTFFSKTYFYNIIVQTFFVLVLFVILSPLFFDRVSKEFLHFVIFLVIVLLLKAWNILLFWIEIKDESILFTYLRWFLNGVFLYGLLEQHSVIAIASLVLLLGLYWIIPSTMKSKRIHWLRLVQMEQQLNAQFYRWMSQFVENPFLESKIKRRSLLNTLTNGFPKKFENALVYMFMKLFLRTETGGIIFRISFLGMITLLFVYNPYAAYIIYVVLLIMIGIQLLAFWQTYQNNFWLGLYPITKGKSTKDFIMSSFYIMLVAAIMIPIPYIIVQFSWINVLIFSLIAIVIPYVFIHWYMAKRIV